MINSVRLDLLDVLRELSEEAPDVRFGQLILNLSYMARGTEDSSAWEIEDAELLEFARQHLTVWKSRQEIPA